MRLEQLAEQVADTSGTVESFLANLAESVHGAAAHAVAFTSVAGLRQGPALAPQPPGPGEVRGAAARWLAARRAGDELRDPVLLRHLLWTAVASGRPLQLHVGPGASGTRPGATDPALLGGFLRATAGLGTDLVLLHGYPDHRYAARLAGIHPHVYVDSGASLARTGAGAATVLAEVLELAPSARSSSPAAPGAARTARRGRTPVPRGARPGPRRLGRRGRVGARRRAAGGRNDRLGEREQGVRAGVRRARGVYGPE